MHCHRAFGRPEHGRPGRHHSSSLPRTESSPADFPGFGHVSLNRDDSAARLTILLPGVPKENLKIEVVKRTLQVEVPQESDGQTPLFSRAFQLGDTLDIDAIDADLALGLLTITLPYRKRRSTQPRRISISSVQEPASSSVETAPQAAPEADVPVASQRNEEAATAQHEEGAAAEPEPAAARSESPPSHGGWVSLGNDDQAAASDDDGSVEDCPVDAVL